MNSKQINGILSTGLGLTQPGSPQDGLSGQYQHLQPRGPQDGLPGASDDELASNMDNPEPADDDLALNMDYSYLLNFQLDPPDDRAYLRCSDNDSLDDEDKLTEDKFEKR